MDYKPVAKDVMRIWIAYVGQGDGIVIQLPSRYSYEVEDGASTREELLEIVVDAGPGGSSDVEGLPAFIDVLYPDHNPVLEYMVISHHDLDHVAGLGGLLGEEIAGIETIFHNGLASYRPGKKGFPHSSDDADDVVLKAKNGEVERAMARFDVNGNLDSSFLVKDIAQLESEYDAGNLQGVYQTLAESILTSEEGVRPERFDRAFEGGAFVQEAEAGRSRIAWPDDIKFDVLWPQDPLRVYGKSSEQWGYTINGNSVTFRLDYGDFSMLFTGDHNDDSETELLKAMKGQLERLSCDVLKVPHHGSRHGVKNFFTRDGFNPVVSVASMGKGFTNGWKHPSDEVIEWLGGAHRVYHTHIHERRFAWATMSAAEQKSMVEKSHVLIETDGKWFRVVEVPLDSALQPPPSVTHTRRGDGTRWISAKGGN